MAYGDSLLTQGERILLRSRQHVLALILDSRLAILFWGIAKLFKARAVVRSGRRVYPVRVVR